jgi:hypothetical protein
MHYGGKKANAVLGMIKRNIRYKSREVIVRLYKALVTSSRKATPGILCPGVESLSKKGHRHDRKSAETGY